MQNIILKHKKYLLFILVIFFISSLVGFLYFCYLDSGIKESVVDTIKTYNTFSNNRVIKDLIIMSTLLIASFFIIGIPLSIFYLSYESFTIGFLFSVFLITYKIKGLLYMLIYLVINRLIPLILIIIFIYKIINIGRYIIGLIIYKDSEIKNKIILNFKKCMYIIVFVLIINILSYFISPLIKIY